MKDLPELQTNVILAPFTTYKIGGKADYFVTVTTRSALIHAVTTAIKAKIPYFILGTGANILIGDLGFRGLVIHNRAGEINIDVELHRATAGSGATVEEVIQAAAQQNLGGLEYFTVVPSSVGGAVRQNFHFVDVDARLWKEDQKIIAGETQYLADRVIGGEILDLSGNIHRVDHDWFCFDYDYSIMLEHPVILLSATFQLLPRDKATILAQIEASAAWRREKQPMLADFPSCGSAFINIPGIGAGRLIDQAGLKGLTIGKVQVSPKHANYLVNLGGATASDVVALIALIKREVLKVTGHKLETEISLIGEFRDVV
jgi:UDP-N-acetylmuramate dehydrogenase